LKGIAFACGYGRKEAPSRAQASRMVCLSRGTLSVQRKKKRINWKEGEGSYRLQGKGVTETWKGGGKIKRDRKIGSHLAGVRTGLQFFRIEAGGVRGSRGRGGKQRWMISKRPH